MKTQKTETITLPLTNWEYEVTEDIHKKYVKWISKKKNKYGPYLIRLSPTGIGTDIEITCEKSGENINITSYHNW